MKYRDNRKKKHGVLQKKQLLLWDGQNRLTSTEDAHSLEWADPFPGKLSGSSISEKPFQDSRISGPDIWDSQIDIRESRKGFPERVPINQRNESV